MSSILVITTSLRAKSNSDRLADEMIRGAKDAGHEVEHISLKRLSAAFRAGSTALRRLNWRVLCSAAE